ncbi:MAG: DNA-directed DNA polymerase II small subunit [Candidatus Bathyarchaeota archaeon]|nr:DNA-directed DNA polymerase II small subunit [Candidatus Bathyarchaeota archaeon]
MTKDLREAIVEITLAGYQLEAEAFELLRILQSEEHFEFIINESLVEANSLSPKPIVITRDLVEKVLSKMAKGKEVAGDHVHLRSSVPLAKEISSDIEIIKDGNEEADSSGTIGDFNQYFRDRYEKLSIILHERLDFRDAHDVTTALEAKYGAKLKMTAIVMNKRERIDQVFLEVEDVESTATVLITSSKSRELFEMARRILPDQVIGIEAVRGKGDLFIAEQVILPDVPEKRSPKADCPVNAILLSDIHVGSKTFCSDAFERLVMWLNGKIGTPKQVDAASRTKYVIIAGDLVDGIGVYPRQEEDLIITSIHEQYKKVAQYIEQIPDYVEIIVIPGNHDAVRQALPQPAISKEFAESVYEVRNVRSLGNPSEVKIHGIHFLLYHGRSLDDVIARVPNLSLRTPEKAMEYLLKCRHLAPEYGARTSLAPECKDRLIITKVPDVFQAGHIHVASNSSYRGTLIVNCGAWQEQTEYQRRMGIDPTPGVMPILNLHTLDLNMMNFISSEVAISPNP